MLFMWYYRIFRSLLFVHVNLCSSFPLLYEVKIALSFIDNHLGKY